MAYTLQKLFHIDREKYKEEYEKRFNSSDTIRLDFKIGNEQAFVCQTPEIMKLIISIERTDKKISNIKHELPSPAFDQFAKRCLVSEIKISNNIEGVHSTRRELKEILNDKSGKYRGKRFYGLVNKYKVLMESDSIPIETCEDIKKIYDDIFLDEIRNDNSNNEPDGKIFRKDKVSVYSEDDREIHQGLFPESRIISAMESALNMMKNEDIDILIRISLFHYLFGYIHPFYDGNGRTSRFISSYMLSKELNYLIAFRISYTIKENIRKYYKAFDTCNNPFNKGELTPFVEMFLEVIDTSLDRLLESLQEGVSRLERYRDYLQVILKDSDDKLYELYYMLIQASLFSDNGVIVDTMARHVSVSESTLRKMLKDIPQDLLVIDRSEREYHYSFDLNKLDELFYAAEQEE